MRSPARSTAGSESYEPLGGLGDCCAYPAGLGVAPDREDVALTAFPGLRERVRQQRKTSGFADHVANQQVDQTPLQQQSVLRGGGLDGLPELGLRHGAHQHQTSLAETSEPRGRSELAQVVRAQGDDDRCSGLSLRNQAGEERLDLVVAGRGEQLLELIDHRNDGLRRTRHCRCPRGERLGPGESAARHDVPARAAPV